MIKWILLFVLFFYNISDFNKIDYNVNKLNYTKKLENYTFNKTHQEKKCDNKNNKIISLSDKKLTDITVNTCNEDNLVSSKDNFIIKNIFLSNNKKISQSEILNCLSSSNIKIDSTFNQSSISYIQDVIKKLYESKNFYNVTININYKIIKDNNVVLNIIINEELVKYIKDIIITGNNSFKDDQLMSLFYSYPNFLQKNIFSHKQYNNEIFKNDLNQLRDFYYKNGYIDFHIKNIQIKSINSEYNVIIQIDINEGLQYKISSFILNSDDSYLKNTFKKLICSYDNKVYDMHGVLKIKNKIKNILLDKGFLKSQVYCKPTVNQFDHTVILNFYIHPGDRFIIHKVCIQGNNFIKDSILYNVVRNLSPGSYAELFKIHEGKLNLENTNYVENVDIKTKFLNTKTHEVDIIYKVNQKINRSFNCSLGYNSSEGINLNFKIHHINWFKSGISTNFDILNSFYKKNIDFVSQIPFLFHESKLNSDFYYGYNYNNCNGKIITRDDEYKISEKFNFPISINNNAEFTIGFIKHSLSQYNKKFILLDDLKYIKNNFEDFIFDRTGVINTNIKLFWEYNNIESNLFPRFGKHISILEDIYFNKYVYNFFKMLFSYEQYYPITKNQHYILHDKLQVRFRSIFSTNYLNNFEDFYDHEVNFIRGINEDKSYLYAMNYHHNGSKFNINISKLNNLLNGNLFFFNQFDLILPNFLNLNHYHKDYFRTSLFVDVGNMLDTSDIHNLQNSSNYVINNHNFNDCRLTSGLEFSCYSRIGILKLLFSYPLLYNSHDSIKYFQFFIDNV